jgi:LmbE family N-acetylglucosaminyl deacetylase
MAHHLWSPSGVAYLAAFCLSLYALALAWQVLRPTLRSGVKQPPALPRANLLALWLLWSTVVAFGVFIVSNHYYAVDARYLSIGFFALAVSASVGLRKLHWRWPEDLLLISSGLLLLVVVASLTALHIHRGQTQALSATHERNLLVADALRHHPVDVLVGDYWRVLPVKFASGGAQNVMPLGGCTQPSATLTSGVWQPNLNRHSFAYLITLDGSLTNFPHCTLPQITAQYGQPNATQIIAGDLAKPKEVLLFYDQGARRPLSGSNAVTLLSSVHPAQLPAASCDQSTTMNIVAHEDDDLLFLNPDLLHAIEAGQCVRTVYLTAGDSGYGKFYWLSRQLGAEAAYASMLGIKKPVWDQQTVSLASGEYLMVATPRGNPKVSLLFFNLPDGDLQGQGFASSGDQSLSKLYDGEIKHIHSVDGQSTYTSEQLTVALTTLMNTYQPAAVHTQADVPSELYPDHSDHIATGKYAAAAATAYDQQFFGDAFTIPVVRYIGYPIHGYDENVSGTDLHNKEAAFLAYARHDGGVCQSEIECADTPTYGAYISRQYTETPTL